MFYFLRLHDDVYDQLEALKNYIHNNIPLVQPKM